MACAQCSAALVMPDCYNLLLQIKSMNFEAWAHSLFAAVRLKHPQLFNDSFGGLQNTVSRRLWALLLLP